MGRLLLLGIVCVASAAVAAPKVALVRLSNAKAQELKLSTLRLTSLLQSSDTKTLTTLRTQVATLERRAGDDNGILQPRDLANAEPRVLAVMHEVYRKLGRRTLPLAEIDRELPAALARLARRGRKGREHDDALSEDVYADVVSDVIHSLSSAYKKKVIEQKDLSPTEFFEEHGLANHTAELLRVAGDAFPVMEQNARGRQTGQAFLRTFTDRELRDLARDWKADVSGSKKGVGQFTTEHLLTPPVLRRLRGEHPALFPEPERSFLGKQGTVAFRTKPDIDDLAKDYRETVIEKKVLSASEFRDSRSISSQRWPELQKKYPDLFPKMAVNFRGRLPGIRNQLSDEKLTAMANAWDELVIHGSMTMTSFCEAQGFGVLTMYKIRDEHPDLFAKPPSGRQKAVTRPLDERFARAVADGAKAALDHDVLASQSDIVEWLNRDAKFTAEFGEVNADHYSNLKTRFPKIAFPDLKDVDSKNKVLVPELAALLDKHPTLTPPEIVAAMQKLHPNFSLSRYNQLRQASPSPGERSTAQRAAPQRVRPSWDRRILAMRELSWLAVRLSPPGTSGEEVGDKVDRLLVARGFPKYGAKKGYEAYLADAAAEHTAAAYGTRVSSEIVAEYAAAAPKGASAEEIYAEVQRDYPTLTNYTFSRYVGRWADAPQDFVALKPFIKNGALVVQGQGKPVSTPRYMGGWDVERLIATAPPAERRELDRLTQFSRMPVHLPLLDSVVKEQHGKRPLNDRTLLWISHLYGSTYTLGRALHELGLPPGRGIVVGTPYGSNDAVVEAMKDDGYDVRVPKLSVTHYRRVVTDAIDDAVALYRKNAQAVIVMDDGGLVSEILHSDPKYADVIQGFRIVEQTTRGITAAEQRAQQLPLINVARSESKRYEGRFIGRVVVGKLDQALSRSGHALKKLDVALIGYGVIGEQIAAQLRKVGRNVTIVEPSEERATAARRAGYRVVPREQALAKADLVVGATGVRSLEVGDLAQLKDGAIVVSASSKQVEIDMEGLADAATKRTVLESESTAKLPNVDYRMKGKTLTVLADGWPINFDGSVEGVPHTEIDLTLSAMLAGTLQAVSRPYRKADHAILALDKKVDEQLLRRYVSLEKKRPVAPISNPDDWPTVLGEFAAGLEK